MSLIDDAYALIAPRGRSIGFIIPGVVIEEIHTDQTGITLHPVELGAAITDHAFLLPARLEMRCGWSDASGGGIGFSQEAYEALLQLRAQREPFSVETGKRSYRNMLIQSLTTATDAKTENALLISVGLQEVLIAQTRSASGSSAPNSAQADPASTGTVASSGAQQLTDSTYANGAPFGPSATTFANVYPSSPNGIIASDQSIGLSPNATLFGQFVPSL